MARFALVLTATLAVSMLSVVSALAETYRFVEADGTVHFTNAPTDPQYKRMGFGPATEEPREPRPPLIDLSPYAREIREAAERYGVQADLIKAVIRVESGFNSRAISPKGARGLMQLMPGTASVLGVRDSFDPRQNIDGGVRHLRGLIDRFGSDLKLALAAYNAGEHAVVSHGGIPPFRETRDYVTRILGLFSPTPVFAAPVAPVPEPEPPQQTFRLESADGTITYTNIPPSKKL
ncbi:MAG: transglycosylase SLT domain-containing protein [Actinomycetota bacterium]